MQIRLVDERPPLLSVEGEIDHTNSSQLRQALTGLVGCDCPVYLDLSNVEFIDSSGIGILLEHAKILHKQGTELRLQQFSRKVYNALFRLGLAEPLGICSTDSPDQHAIRGAREPGDRWMISSFTVPMGTSAPSTIRSRIGQLIADLPLSEIETAEVQFAVGEAVANAVKHGSTAGEGCILVLCVADSRALTVEVSDSGPGFDRETVPAPDFSSLPTSGMGIAIMELLMDEVKFERDRGTTVRMVKLLRQ